MAANTVPIFGRAPDVQLGGAIFGPTAVTATNGTGNLQEIFQADPTEGSWVSHVTLKPVGGNTAATVCRIFLCKETGTFTPGTTNDTTNTHLIAELTLNATAASNTAAVAEYRASIRQAIPAGYRLLIGFGTSTGAAGVGYVATVFGSKY